MCRKLFLLTSFLVVLGLVGSASAAVPAPWQNQDIDTTDGGADESDGTWTISADGADIWDNSDQFHYVYQELTGSAMMVARVTDNGTGSNAWSKGGVMIRQSLAGGSTHAYMPITGGEGNGYSFQRRLVADAGSSSDNGVAPALAPPYWVKIERVGNDFSGYISPNGVKWNQFGVTVTIEMTDPVLIGLAVTSHAAGEIRTFMFDNVTFEPLVKAMKPIPADGAVDVDVTSLEWIAGEGAVSHKVYLSTDATIDEADLLAEGPLALAFADLAPGADYYWRVDEVDADGALIEGELWSFSTLPIEAHFPGPEDGAKGVALDTKLSWIAGKGAIMHDVYFGTDEAAVAASDPSTFQGKVMDASFDPGPLEPFTSYYWKVDEFAIVVTNPGPVWSFESFDPDAASEPDPADGAADVDNMPLLTWMASETAFLHDVYFGTDADLVAAGDASVSQGQLTEASFAPAEALDRGITYYWKVDVSTGAARDSVLHPGNLWSFRVVDRNTDNWAATVAGDSPAFLATYVEDGLYDIGAFSGDITYEFVVRSNPDETEASMCLIGRRQFGDTQAGLKYEQWNNTGTYGATLFGVVDLDYGVPTAPGEYTVLAFVSSEDAGTTTLYVNGVQEGSIASAITLSGLVGIGYGAQGEDGTGVFDDFDGALFGVAIYDTALSDDVIAKHSDSYFTPIAITDPDLLIYYDFESGEGTTVLDRSGHGNHSLFFGNPEWAIGIFGGALAVDIADLDYIETVAPLNIVSNTVTVTGWVKHDESPAAWSGILTHRGTEPGCLGLQHDGTELRYMWGADVYWSFSSGLQMPNGEWYFAALAISPEQGKLYLNGIEQTATNVAEHEPTNFDSLIRVGRDHNDDRIMTSLIDEVRFYNKTLTDVEILKLMGTISDVTAPGDIVQGVPNDGLMDGDNFGWPPNETPDLAIDDDTSTKFLHFKGELEPTGFQVTPAAGPSIVTGLALTTANDAAERDPVTFELSGSNEGIDGPYELIASGDIVDFSDPNTAWPRFTMNATPISFDNDVAYNYYQVMFPTVRDAASANSMQIAEVELLGVPSPLVGHWTFDEGAGTVALDSSGNWNDGIFVGDPQWVAGVVGGALEFNGDDYIDCGNGPSLQIQDAITIAFWFNVVAFENTWEAFLSKGDSAYRVSRGGGDGDATHFGISGSSAGGGNGWFNGNAIVTGGVWHHFAGTYDGAEGRIYIDGVLDSTTEATGQINIETDGFWIGNNSQNPDRLLHGILDDVRIYNQALSVDEISQLAGNILVNGGFENGVVEPWSTYGDVTAEVVQELVGAAVPEAPIEGSSCLHVVVAEAGANFWDSGLQHAGHVFEAGKQYTLSAFLKCSQGTLDINFKLEIGQDPWTGYGDQAFTMTEEWTEFSITTPVFDEDVSPACITFHIGYAVADFWIDGVKFVEVQ